MPVIYTSSYVIGKDHQVAVKVLRASTTDVQDPSYSERLEKVTTVFSACTYARTDVNHQLIKAEVGIWHELDHINVVKLLGTCGNFGPQVSMVLPWYANGNLHGFLQKHKSLVYSERLRLVGSYTIIFR